MRRALVDGLVGRWLRRKDAMRPRDARGGGNNAQCLAGCRGSAAVRWGKLDGGPSG